MKPKVTDTLKGKRFLLTHWSLSVLGGSENNILQMAEYIIQQGGEVEMFTYASDNPLRDIFKNKNIKVTIDDVDFLASNLSTKIKYDLDEIDYVVICHNVIPLSIIEQLNNKDITTKFIFFHMSPLVGIAMEAPILYELESKIASKVLTISEGTTHEQLERLLGEDIERLYYYRNPVPDNFIKNIGESRRSETLRKIAVISNHPPLEVRGLVDNALLKSKGVNIEFIGRWSKNPTLVTAELLLKYDAVVSIGKTVQYCLVMGVPVYIYDRFGGQGYMDDYYSAKKRNFSGRDAGKKTTDEIAQELIYGYLEAVEYHKENIDEFRKEYLLSNVIDGVFDPSRKVQNYKFSQRYLNYLISMQMVFKRQYIDMTRVATMQRKIDNLSQQQKKGMRAIDAYEKELKSFLSVRRSLKLLAGNLKRKIENGK